MLTHNHIKGKLRFVSLTVITLSYFFVKDHPQFNEAIFWGFTLTGWITAAFVYSWKGKKTGVFLEENENKLRLLDFMFVLGYMTVTGGIEESPYVYLIYLGIASVGLYGSRRLGLVYSLLALAVLVEYDILYHQFMDGNSVTTWHIWSNLCMLPVFGLLADMLISHFQNMRENEEIVLDQLVTSLAKAIGSKDSYTLGHSTRVQIYALAIGSELKLSQEDMFTLRYGALLHDIGKIHIPSNVLNKTERLTSDEWNELKGHSIEGARIMAGLQKLSGVRDIVLYHHEKYDGTGYPNGLRGEEIPFLAAIVNVADSFDAMTSTRSYNKPRTVEEGMAEVQRCIGTQFHPKAAYAALALFQKGQWPRFKQIEESAESERSVKSEMA